MANTRKPRCCSCCQAATRTVTDSELCLPLPLCDTCIGPDEILERAAMVRKNWPRARWAQQCDAVRRRRPLFFDAVYRIVADRQLPE